jgi:hypothetical protein
MQPWYDAQGRGAADRPLDGAVRDRLWYSANGGPTRVVVGKLQGVSWRGASWGRHMASGGARPREARRVRSRGARDVAFRCRNRFNLGHFEHDFLPNFELKCTRW